MSCRRRVLGYGLLVFAYLYVCHFLDTIAEHPTDKVQFVMAVVLCPKTADDEDEGST